MAGERARTRIDLEFLDCKELFRQAFAEYNIPHVVWQYDCYRERGHSRAGRSLLDTILFTKIEINKIAVHLSKP
jgi:hypothetical protein